MSALGRKMVDGMLSGAFRGSAMSISTKTEMRLRGRPPSRVPAQTVERLLEVELGERAEQLPELASSALHHGVYAAGTNLAYARLSRRGRSAARAG